MRARLAGVSGAARAAAALVITRRIAALPAWRAARTVLLFAPLATEPDISGLLELALSAGKTVCYPRVSGGGLLIYQVRRREDLRAGSFGVLEPDPAGCALVSPAAVDLALVPGLAFDAGGHRLGRGKGYYDRWLATTKALTVGVGFALQLTEQIPVEPHDVPLALTVSERP